MQPGEKGITLDDYYERVDVRDALREQAGPYRRAHGLVDGVMAPTRADTRPPGPDDDGAIAVEVLGRWERDTPLEVDFTEASVIASALEAWTQKREALRNPHSSLSDMKWYDDLLRRNRTLSQRITAALPPEYQRRLRQP